jgi:hypothetical protein
LRNTRRSLVPVALAATLIPLGTVLTFFWVASDADQGFSQRIFYIHVPIALTSYVFFGIGAFYAARYLIRRDPDDDLKSYVALHIGIIFGTLVLLTGPVWAKVSWGHWWNWSDEQLNVFLILFLFYSAYFMLRFSLDPGPQRPRAALVRRGPPRQVAYPPRRLHLERAADGQPDVDDLPRLVGRHPLARLRHVRGRDGRQATRRATAPRARAAGGLTCCSQPSR